MISVESTAETIHIHIPRGEVSDARLAELLRGLRLEPTIAERMDEILSRVPAALPLSENE